ncbi:hypothetical protein BGW42_003374 [Actinomortierella wolfii]|nr:hypothetical protein BGW42_003374 [Actinomortierella wolfii]
MDPFGRLSNDVRGQKTRRGHEAKTERYRVIIIADPQLTDWFSYGQSGFLLTLVEIYTDLYMRRAFSRLHASLKPDAVLFLGDLNDGGRESSDAVFEKNGKRFFKRVFQTRHTAWNQQPLVVDPVVPMEGQHDVMSSSSTHYRQVENVPLVADVRAKIRLAGQSVRFYVAGNHDVGFGDTLIRPSLTRYKKMFGAVNYEIEVGNHSFVVLDTLSLSSGIQDIRHESDDFLNKISQEPPKLPRILFTHFPLFRLDTTKCGPERETTQLIVNGNGTQYQNMVNLTLSQQILAGVQPDMIFSGDDHDWCEVAHPVVNNSSNDTITSFSPEVTLPTFSFAQGIMQPGFVVMSLYNPSPQKVRNVYPAVPAASGLPTTLNETMSRSIARPSTDATFAYAECLLPVQLFIYLGYGIFFVCTVMTIGGLRFWWMEHKERQYREDALQHLGQEQQEHPSQHVDLMVLLESTTSTSSAMANEPSSSLPSYTANIRYDGHEIIADLSSYGYAAARKRYWWPIQSPIFWKMCGWDVWNVAKYAIPFYFFLFIMSII